jgi:ribosomal protein S18 acetylase RimI-like enzyme
MGAETGTLTLQLRDELLRSDRPQIERIVRSCGYFREDEIAVALELTDDRLTKGAMSDYRFVIAAHGDQVVGYCCYGRIPCTVHSYDIYWIVVDPEAQRSGIGRKLLAAAEDRIRAAGGARVYVETSNRPQYESTRKFYLRVGYSVECVLREFYAPNDDKVVFL